MRILYAILCAWLWIIFLGVAIASGDPVSNETFFLTTSIITAGALSGGD